jgi:hypothetical protein
VATAGAGLLAAAFKNYGLMVVVPLADMAYRRGGWRALRSREFLVPLGAIVLPMAAWVLGVFVTNPNPTSRTTYFIFQVPATLFSARLAERLTLGLFVRDIGPVSAVLKAVGVRGVMKGRVSARPLVGWTLMGVLFLVLLAPKLADHDYYELMAMPAAAGWGALGWKSASLALSDLRLRRTLGWAAAVLAGVLQSPLVMNEKYETEVGHLVVARRLKEIVPPSEKVVVLGQRIGWPIVHYCGRQGWVDQCQRLPDDWERFLLDEHIKGATCVAVYFDPTVSESDRDSFQPLIGSLPLVERGEGPWFRRGRPCEYYLLDLHDAPARLAERERSLR